MSYPTTVGPFTVSTVTTNYQWPIPGTYWRGTFYVHGRHFVVYGDGTGVVYRHSSDEGATWSAPVTVRTPLGSDNNTIYMSVHFDGIYLSYALAAGPNLPLYYRRGRIETNGSITWSAAEQTVIVADPNYWAKHISITTDSEGYPAISYQYYYSAGDKYAWVIKSSANDGTWSTEAGYPLQLSTFSSNEWKTEIISLGFKRLFVLYSTYNALVGYELYTKAFDGSSWEAAELFTPGDQRQRSIAPGPNGSVYLSYTFNKDMQFRVRPWGGPWGARIKVLDESSNSFNVITTGPDGSIYILQFTNYGSYVDYVIYALSTDGGTTWTGKSEGPLPEVWIDETVVGATQGWIFSSAYKTWDGVLGFVYTTGNSSPYNVRYAALRFWESEDLKAKFEVGQGSVDLKAEFRVGQGSADFFAELIIRQKATVDLSGEFTVRHEGIPVEVLGKALVRHLGSAELLGKFDVGQDSAELLGKFEAQVTAELLGKGIIRNVGSAELLGNAEIRQLGSVELLGKGIIRQSGSAELLGKAKIQHLSSAELLVKVEVRGLDSSELLGKAVIRHVGTPLELLGKTVIKQPGSAELLGKTEVQQSGSAELLGRAEVQQSGSAELIGRAEIRQSDSADLLGKAIIRHLGSADLLGKAIVKNVGSAELLGKFEAQVTAELLGKVEIQQSGSAELLGKAKVQQSGSAEILGNVEIRQSGSAELLGRAEVRQPDSAELLGEFIVRHEASADLLGEFIARHEASRDLLGEFISKNVGSADFLGELVVRHEASVDLHAAFESQASVDLLGEFTVRQIATINLLGKFIIKHSAELDLPAKLQVTHSERLFAKLWIRHPYRLWTNRRYVNGVVELDETELDDALLGYVIEGVMNDIRSQLISEAMLVYNSWTDISKTPKLIRRATTYGTVASLYSRDINNPNRRIVMGLRPIRIRAAEVRSAQERAMDYWETRMEKMMSLYLTSVGRRLMIVDTEDEEAVFSLEDVPFYTEDPFRIKLR